MGARPKPALFLARAGYRQRRLRDAARLLPVVGAILWLMPLLWPREVVVPGATSEALRTSAALLWIFGIWIALIAGAALMARRLRPDDEVDTPRDEAD